LPVWVLALLGPQATNEPWLKPSLEKSCVASFPGPRLWPITRSPGRLDRSELCTSGQPPGDDLTLPESSVAVGRHLNPRGTCSAYLATVRGTSSNGEMAHHWRIPKPLRRRTPPPIVLPGRGGSVYKYFSEQAHADGFLDGHLLFRTLAYFRDNEDAVRGDEYEGTSKFLLEGGLVVHNHTQGSTFTLPMAFESSVRAYEIFVYCTIDAERRTR